jgi:hypothetical protein
MNMTPEVYTAYAHRQGAILLAVIAVPASAASADARWWCSRRPCYFKETRKADEAL